MNKGSNHRRPLRHWKGGPPRWAWRLLMELAVVLLVLVALIVIAEAVCGAMGAPRAITDLR